MNTNINDNNDGVIRINSARKSSNLSIGFGIVSAAIGGMMIPMGGLALPFGIIYAVGGLAVIGIGVGGRKMSTITLPAAKPAYAISDESKQLAGKLLEYIDSIDNKSTEAAKKYIRTASKMRSLLFMPEYDENAYDDDKSLMKILVKGTSLNKGYMQETPELINKNSRYAGLGGDAEQDAKNNLSKICEQLDDIDDAISKIQQHIVNSTNMEVDSASEYLKIKLGADAPDSLNLDKIANAQEVPDELKNAGI